MGFWNDDNNLKTIVNINIKKKYKFHDLRIMSYVELKIIIKQIETIDVVKIRGDVFIEKYSIHDKR